MSMLRINKESMINAEQIEAIIPFASKPVRRLVENAKAQDRLVELRGGYGWNTVIVTTDNTIYLVSNVAEFYIARLKNQTYTSTNVFTSKNNRSSRAYIRTDLIRDAVRVEAGKRTPSRSTLRRIKNAKTRNVFTSLAEGRRTNIYAFTFSGHVYGIYSVADSTLDFSSDAAAG